LLALIENKFLQDIFSTHCHIVWWEEMALWDLADPPPLCDGHEGGIVLVSLP
jgi:hypothetical protein